MPVRANPPESRNAADMARIAARVLTLGTVEEIEQFLRDSFNQPGQREKVKTE